MELLESLELIGPGRWLELPMMDWQLQLENAEQQVLEKQPEAAFLRLKVALAGTNLNTASEAWAAPEIQPVAAAEWAAQWLGRTAIALQQWAGHRVEWSSTRPDRADGRAGAQFEFEDLITGRQAGELAVQLLSRALQPSTLDSSSDELVDRMTAFYAAAVQRIFPPDAELLMATAIAQDIPVCKLDREPYEEIKGDFRRRPNGLLRLGHACHQQVVDGTLCLQRSAPVWQQFSQPGADLAFLRSLGAPVAPIQGAIDGQKPAVNGKHYRFLCAGQQLLAVVDAEGREVTGDCDSSWLEWAATAAQRLELGMVVLEASCENLSLDGRQSGGFFTRIDISPRLDSLMSQATELCGLMAEDFVSWMFPPGAKSRIPIFSVTGTNGKTTICRMLVEIARQAGFRAGLACTDGVYLNYELMDAGDFSGSNGHHQVLESHEINLAVLETARGAVLHSGFAFDHSDVAVCSNVTAEHLGEFGIDTVEQMSEIKGLIVARARKAAVLNFDDAHCRHIGTDLAVPRLCWTSMAVSSAHVFAHAVRADRVLCLENITGVEWIVSHQQASSERLLPVRAIPATFAGTARHNVSNALQAIAAALELGIEWKVIEQAMGAFSMGIDSTPGRLNLHEGNDFPVLLDFVQNLDGMRALCEFVAQRKVRGNRILVMSVLGRHEDVTVREFARYAAQHFDLFICRNYAKTYRHRSQKEIPQLLRHELLELGIAAENIQLVLDETPAIDAALKLATPDDMVVIMCGLRASENWQQISDFARVRIPD